MAHKHSVRDMGAHFLIDQFTRQIKNDSANKTTIVQYDHNSERLTFEIPLYVDGHAMTLCDLIEIHYINISTDGNSQNPGTYEVNDIKAEGENAVFTWLISQECTQLAGSLNFFIVFKCTENGVTVYRWGTEIYKNLPISAGMDNGEAVLTEYPDILAQWKAQLFDASDTAVLNVATAEANALAAIETAGEAKKQSVLDSIPDEYEALSALADQNHRNKAGAIVLDVEGESIVVNDASEYPLQNLKVFGRSTQDGTPTPDAPVDIVSVEAPVVTVNSKNLLRITAKTQTLNGVTFTVNEDGSFTAKGTSTGDTYFGVNYDVKNLIPGKIYYLNGCPNGGGANTYRLYAQTIDGATFAGDVGSGTRFTAKDGQWQVLFAVYRNVTVDLTVYPMLRLASVEDATFEPYNSGSVAISTPTSLPGIPVSSGGNYTDANGQKWICDEVDLARGVYVQRVAMTNYDGSDDERWVKSAESYFYLVKTSMANPSKANGSALSTRFVFVAGSLTQSGYFKIGNAYGPMIRVPGDVTDVDGLREWIAVNPFSVLYELENPIETPLSEAEISAFKALHSNRPNTTILNDAGAHMAVSYVADTKTYIDNAIAKITNA